MLLTSCTRPLPRFPASPLPVAPHWHPPLYQNHPFDTMFRDK